MFPYFGNFAIEYKRHGDYNIYLHVPTIWGNLGSLNNIFDLWNYSYTRNETNNNVDIRY